MYFSLFISLLILQRISELVIAKRTEQWLLAQGAIEYGKGHYPYMIAMHTLFIISLVAEYVWRGPAPISWMLLATLIALLVFKYWTLWSLGKYWNTKIYRVPGARPVEKGPYKFLKHPNYIEVVCEIAIIPLVFHLYYTAMLFSVLNAVMLYIRIRVENQVWADATAPDPRF